MVTASWEFSLSHTHTLKGTNDQTHKRKEVKSKKHTKARTLAHSLRRTQTHFGALTTAVCRVGS